MGLYVSGLISDYFAAGRVVEGVVPLHSVTCCGRRVVRPAGGSLGTQRVCRRFNMLQI